MLARFNQRFPGMQVSVRVGNSQAALEALVDYQTDVAVLAQFTDDPRFHSVPYSRHPIVIFVHRKHRFARRKSIRIAELEGEGMILREEGSTTRKALDDALTKAGVKPRVVMEIGSREAIREAVIKGVGIGAVSEIEYIPDPDDQDGEGERRRDVHPCPRRLPGGAARGAAGEGIPRDRRGAAAPARRTRSRRQDSAVISGGKAP